MDEWNKVTDILLQQGVTAFSVSGGEALMKDGLIDILSHIRRRLDERGIRNKIVLISNGRLMSDYWLEQFKRLDVHLSMSLPGYNTFSTLTGHDGADNVLHWFERTKAIGLSTTANITVTKINVGELYETISLALLAGAESILLNRFLPGGRGLSNSDRLMLSPRQVVEMLDTAEEVLSLAHRFGNVGTEIPLCVVGNQRKYSFLHVGYRCAAAKGFFVVDPSGQIRTCNHSPHVVGHVFAEPMIVDTDYWNLFSNSDFKPPECSGCSSLRKCDCGCREVAAIVSGSPCVADPSVGEVTPIT